MKGDAFFKSPAGQAAVMAAYDDFVARLPPTYERITIPTRRGHTFCLAAGEKNNPPLVLLHGQNGNSSSWICGGEMESLSKRFRVYAVDIIGEPGKSEYKRLPFEGPEYALWLLDVLQSLNVQAGAVDIVGISYGGWLALKFATTYPAYVKRLVLLAAGGISKPRISFILRCIFYAFQGDEGIRKTVRSIANPQTLHPEIEEQLVLVFRHFVTRTTPPPVFSDSDLRRLRMPVLFIGGAKDVILSSEKSARRLKRLLPSATVKIIPNANHALMNTQVEVDSFLG